MLNDYFTSVFDMFPVFLWKNFLVPTQQEKRDAIDLCLSEYKFTHLNRDKDIFIGHNFEIDTKGFLKKLNNQFDKMAVECFGEPNEDRRMFCYISNNKENISEWHTHTHSGASLIGVYYLEIEEGTGPIEFEKHGVFVEYYPKLYDLLVFPHDLNHRPKADGLTAKYRISLNLDRCYTPQEKLRMTFEL